MACMHVAYLGLYVVRWDRYLLWTYYVKALRKVETAHIVWTEVDVLASSHAISRILEAAKSKGLN